MYEYIFILLWGGKLQIGCFEWVSPWKKKELHRSLKNIYCTKSKIGKFPEKASSALISQRKPCVGEVSNTPGVGVAGNYELPAMDAVN